MINAKTSALSRRCNAAKAANTSAWSLPERADTDSPAVPSACRGSAAICSTMALPLMLSLLVQSLYNIVDGIFVARVSEEALTATSLAYPVPPLMVAVSMGTGAGVNVAVSWMAGGAGSVWYAVWTSELLAVLFSICGARLEFRRKVTPICAQ